MGTYHWVATYNGDANNTTVSSGCAAEPVTITQATPAIATTPSAGGPVGTSISRHGDGERRLQPDRHGHLQPVRAGTRPAPGPPLFTSTNSPLSGGSATSAAFTPTAVGTYHWVATYNGDANNTTVSSACAAEPVTITQATPAIATTPSAGGPVGTSISRHGDGERRLQPDRHGHLQPVPAGDTHLQPGPRSSPPPNTAQRGQRHLRSPLRAPPRWAPTTGSPPTTVTPTTARSAPAARPSR